ncbi:DsbA family oxidoreductase [Dermatobacter hominis]|uniref:DsbA family oxidoreductase n=1 Tax=Dermatobacter hominis TaxID=2884263 RepID=UPI001D10D43C|nr:DsbA family oxidoreductase [Dermatobacter hominis]UDY36878.1 DsbA family oxidoreductase [Dermatobacter hominis]
MHIDIWSDMVCPWCYLGSRRLGAALDRFAEAHPDQPVTVRWRAFELDPGAPPEPQELRPALEKKYGAGSFDAMTGRLVSLGGPEGIDYRFDIAQRVNTFDAHRLVAWAATVEPDDGEGSPQDRLVERIFHAYFTDGADVSDHDVLADLAEGAGLDRDVAAEVLASGAFADEVRTEESGARTRDITGVPAVVIDDRVLVPGAQEVETFLRVLEKVAATPA